MPKALPVIDVSAPICCAPLAAGPMSTDTAVELALRLKALADPIRIQMMSLLMADPTHEMTATDLASAVSVSGGTATHHLNQLRSAGLVASQRRGVNNLYRAEPANLEALRGVLDTCC
ncbi:metalloregulator ArsR/SmtB family transcription factor [Gordonia pseudamarae]|jgi:ArsR family transcriptional regulator|uniref:Metalloregulator ArsR/SmtB family transcription factor n=1 Tax=Gordonia pseudamarae TaxID=2831662 RepID=A0ABX6IHB5_9ACTN|nr:MULTISPECIES: Rv2640c family ArsR-like transcriptional regulator [Gordonia]MBD0022462.1 winged helix-turn-helix transcriptional regulator [Gordonia sp. (in: high G+C Gram-positive bacteria)]QHN26351.1 metalloregulator ArsR/SmtB family transcription factor [Gordonia pseudamarae]QHN35243.1 metalloregulator ArsR/SmtB family transcription factor [Gordonia pseudamarae]